jgi:hydroxymethylbilane synthase
MHKLRIGTRGSKLAIIQATIVKNELINILHYPENLIEIITIKTSGDKFATADLSQIGGKGLFIKEIEEALLINQIDIAVHSLKDVPAFIPEGLEICAVLEREDPRDILLTQDGLSFLELKKNAIVGTCSPRRKVQLLNLRPDLQIVLFRGNIDTRIKNLRLGSVDATMLAIAGIKRAQISDIKYQILETDVILPAVGQGALAIEVKNTNTDIKELLSHINHEKSFIEVTTERSFLKALEADCISPVAAYAKFIDANTISFECLVATEDYKHIYREKRIFNIDNCITEAYLLGQSLKLYI